MACTSKYWYVRTSVRVLIYSNVNIRWHWKRDTTASHEHYRKAQYVVLALFVPHINASLSWIRHWSRKCIDGLVRGKDDQRRVAIRPRRKTRCARQSQRETVAYHARTSLLRYKTTKNNRKRVIYVQGTFCTLPKSQLLTSFFEVRRRVAQTQRRIINDRSRLLGYFNRVNGGLYY